MTPSQSQGHYLSYVENLAAIQIGPNARAAIMSQPRKELVDIHSEYHLGFDSYLRSVQKLGTSVFEPNSPEPPRPYDIASPALGEFRPLIHGRLNAAALVFGGDTASVWASENASQTALDGIKHHLLYAHSLVLPDPLFYILQFTDNEENIFFEKSRNCLANFLDFLGRIRPLIEAGIVSFYPQYEHGSLTHIFTPFKDEEFRNWFLKTQEWDDYEGISKLLQERAVELVYFCKRHRASCAVADDDRQSQWLEGLFRYGRVKEIAYDRALGNPVLADERTAYQRLTKLSLKVTNSISVEDLVAVRQNSDGFAAWRDALQECIGLIEDSEMQEKDLAAAIQYKCARAVDSLDKEIRNSTFMSKITEETKGFILGSTAAGALLQVLAGTAASTAAMPAIAISAAAKVLAAWQSARESGNAARALRKHYALWFELNGEPAAAGPI
jgi:hypothetical protein